MSENNGNEENAHEQNEDHVRESSDSVTLDFKRWLSESLETIARYLNCNNI